MLREELAKRKLPTLRSREEMKEIMLHEVFGYLPEPESFSVTADEPEIIEKRFNCGSVVHSRVNLTVTLPTGKHTFYVNRLLHNGDKKRPTILLCNFHDMMYSRYFPVEELSEYDVNFIVYNYQDITSDDGDFTNGIAPLLLPNGKDTDTTCGKIGIWAWTNMRVLDYVLTLPGVDPENIAISGHSRLGKTALLTGMCDERFKFVFSNAAGCAGDSIAHGSTGVLRADSGTRNGRGENINDIWHNFPYWFCNNYEKYTGPLVSEEFDQHYLLAAIAPRYVAIGSCSLDIWADPESQQLCALAASEAWEKAGLSGLVGGDEAYIDTGVSLDEGNLCFFKIKAPHFLSRHSWRHFIRFIEKHK